MAQAFTLQKNGLGGVPTQEHQIDQDVLSDAVGYDEGGGDGTAEYVQATGGAGDVLQGEVGRGGGLVAHDDECAHAR